MQDSDFSKHTGEMPMQSTARHEERVRLETELCKPDPVMPVDDIITRLRELDDGSLDHEGLVQHTLNVFRCYVAHEAQQHTKECVGFQILTHEAKYHFLVEMAERSRKLCEVTAKSDVLRQKLNVAEAHAAAPFSLKGATQLLTEVVELKGMDAGLAYNNLGVLNLYRGDRREGYRQLHAAAYEFGLWLAYYNLGALAGIGLYGPTTDEGVRQKQEALWREARHMRETQQAIEPRALSLESEYFGEILDQKKLPASLWSWAIGQSQKVQELARKQELFNVLCDDAASDPEIVYVLARKFRRLLDVDPASWREMLKGFIEKISISVHDERKKLLYKLTTTLGDLRTAISIEPGNINLQEVNDSLETITMLDVSYQRTERRLRECRDFARESEVDLFEEVLPAKTEREEDDQSSIASGGLGTYVPQYVVEQLLETAEERLGKSSPASSELVELRRLLGHIETLPEERQEQLKVTIERILDRIEK